MPMAQHFYGPIDQVAGRDIVNIDQRPATLWDCDYPTLQDQRSWSRAKLWALRHRLLVSWPSAIMAVGVLLLLSHLRFGLWSVEFLGVDLFGPYLAMTAIMSASLGYSILAQQTAKGIAFHRQRLELIDLIIQAKY